MDHSGPGSVAWDQVRHAYGPAVDVPGWIGDLRVPDKAAESLDALYGSITHQGTRYSATAVSVPYLAEAALDRTVPDRAGVIFLIEFCATGNAGDYLDWRRQRGRQAGPHERASWDAVVAEHGRLRGLLADSDRAVAGAVLRLLAWTGDQSDLVLTAVRRAVESGDERDQCIGWLSSVVLGRLPPGLPAPVAITGRSPAGRFGAAVAAVQFGGRSTAPDAVDELCSVFASLESDPELTDCEFLMPDGPARVAGLALADVPAHLRRHANSQLLAAIARGDVLGTEPLRAYLRLNLGDNRLPDLVTAQPIQARLPATVLPAETRAALTDLLDPLDSWRDSLTIDHQIHELEEHGLPGTPDQLATWLGSEPA
jgi:hypothetical protein